MSPLLEVKDLKTHFFTREGVVHAVDGVSYSVEKGKTLGLVGESGCGKSVSAMSIMRLIPDPPGKIVQGNIMFEGRDLVRASDREMRDIRGNQISMIFQDPMTSLNPVVKIGVQMTEGIHLHLGLSRREAEDRAVELLEAVGMPDSRRRLRDYPHQFSGGMRQRVMIAMALSCDPKLLIADEPTTALDVTIQAQILDLLQRLQDRFGMSILLITHDLGVVAGVSDHVCVMYAGKIVEQAETLELFEHPQHPYTIALLNSIPRLDAEERGRLASIAGLPPDLVEPPAGCRFHSRCRFATDRCRQGDEPLLASCDGTEHLVACRHPHNVANDKDGC
ncbi:MAG: ABC transporter ATP-binding protein [Actinobacteria bacterium]|nr:ABC transporter ATP-binding protein [Actinomycetota bacterium]